MRNFAFYLKLGILVLLGAVFLSPKTSAQSASANPSTLAFGSKAINTSSVLNTKVSASGILVVNVSTIRFSITGTNANQFTVPTPGLLGNITEIIEALLSGGVEIPVTYAPTEAGNHSATLVVSIDRLLASTVSVNIPLTGTSANYLKVQSTSPANGATGILADTPVTITFDRPVSIVNAGLIQINGTAVNPAQVSVSNSVLTITPVSQGTNTSTSIVVPIGAIKGTDDNVLQSNINISYSTSTTSASASANPASLSFGSKTIATSSVLNTKVSSSGLLGLNISTIRLSITGANANQFTVPDLGLLGNITELVTALLSGGVEIPVTYAPTEPGSHSATLVVYIDRVLGGATIPVSIPLTGSSVPNYLKILSYSPADEATDVLAAAPIKIVFDRAISILNTESILMNGTPIDMSQVSIQNGNTLVINPVDLPASSSSSLVVLQDAVLGADGNVLKEAFSISYVTTPVLILSNHNSLQFTASINNSEIKSLLLTSHPILSTLNITNAAIELTGDNSSMFTVEQVADPQQFVNNMRSAGVSVNVIYSPTTEGVHNARLIITLTTDDNIPITAEILLSGSINSTTNIDKAVSDRVIVSEVIYSLSGVKVSEVTSSGVYIRKVVYSDGTTKTEKASIKK